MYDLFITIPRPQHLLIPNEQFFLPFDNVQYLILIVYPDKLRLVQSLKFTVSLFIPLFDNLAFRRIYDVLSNLNLPFTNCIISLAYIIFYAIPLLSYKTHLLLVSQYRMLICNLSQYITPYIMYFLLSPVACCGGK